MAYKRQAPNPRDLPALHACLRVKMQLYTNKHFQMKLLWSNVRERKKSHLNYAAQEDPNELLLVGFQVILTVRQTALPKKIITRLRMKQYYYIFYLQKR